MTNPESFNSDAELTSPYNLANSIVPPLGLPTLESGRYILDIRFNRSWPKQAYSQHEVQFTDNYAEASRALAQTARTLAWINFFAKPQVTIKHSNLAVEHGKHHRSHYDENFQTEVLTGERFSIGENQYVVNYSSEDGLEFKSYSQVLQDGELTPYMEEWLSRILSEKNNFHPVDSDVQPFAKWLRAKRPDNDFGSSYFI